MGFFSRLFGSRPPSETKPTATGAGLAWSGSYNFRILGGAERQRELEELFNGFTGGGPERYCMASLVREANDAVRVHINNRTVGYLSPAEAAEYCQRMRAMGKGDEIEGVCMALIANDGFVPGQRFVVLLDLKWPIEELQT